MQNMVIDLGSEVKPNGKHSAADQVMRILSDNHPCSVNKLAELSTKAGLNLQEVWGIVREMRASGVLGEVHAEMVEANGCKFHIHPSSVGSAVSRELCLHGRYERFETSTIPCYLRRGDVVIDVGANIGYYTVLLSKCVGPEGVVFAFEPDAANFAVLQKNLIENRCMNVRAFQSAVADKTGEIDFYPSSKEGDDHRTWNPGDRKACKVQCVSLDDFLDMPKVDFIKSDTQGAETAVLRGGKKLIDRSASVTLFVEFWPEGLIGVDGSENPFINTLHELGFDKIYSTDEQDSKLVDLQGRLRTIRRHLNGVPPNSNDWIINLICLKR